MLAEMKWYIFDDEHHPLCWAEGDDCPCCEFDTRNDAERFHDALFDLPMVEGELDNLTIKECIFFYDGGKRNMSGLIPVANGDNIDLEAW